MSDKLEPISGMTIMRCKECGQNYGLAQRTDEGSIAIFEAHNKKHDNVFYLTPPQKVTTK